MDNKRMKQYLMLLMVIGVIAAAASGSGTFASFSAQVTNPGNTFASGTLYLHDQSGSTTCTSESNSLNVNPGTGAGGTGDGCAVLFNGIDLATTTTSSANIALNNAGSVNAQNIKFRVNNCTVTTNGGSTTFGTAPTCGDFYITIQEKTDGTYASNKFCAFGPGVLAAACAAPANTVTLASSQAGGFANLSMDNGSGSATPASLTAGSTRYYTIRIDANPPSGNNALQNRKVSFDLDWQIVS
jgi:predicted ribosomally synthesized peptide with SipW-like signal peptide